MAGLTDVTPANNGSTITVSPGAFVNDTSASVDPATGCVAFTTTHPGRLHGDTNGTGAGGGTVSSGIATSATKQFNTSGTF